jgi:hypothetical protein
MLIELFVFVGVSVLVDRLVLFPRLIPIALVALFEPLSAPLLLVFLLQQVLQALGPRLLSCLFLNFLQEGTPFRLPLHVLDLGLFSLLLELVGWVIIDSLVLGLVGILTP